MAIIITDECINCGACEPECPNNAIYEGGVEWNMSEGTTLTGKYTLETNEEVGVNDPQLPVMEDYYFIVADKCTECVGHHDEPSCVQVCPVECILPDPNRQETLDQLADKFMKMAG